MKLKPSYCIIAFLSSAFQAFGMYNVHALSGVTEGGVLGLVLLIDHWLSISPALSGFVLNAACYLLGWRTLGKTFHRLFGHCGGGIFHRLRHLRMFSAPVARDRRLSPGRILNRRIVHRHRCRCLRPHRRCHLRR